MSRFEYSRSKIATEQISEPEPRAARHFEINVFRRQPGDLKRYLDRKMIALLGFVLATVLMSISALHLYWACGGQWGASVVVPTAFENESDSVEKPLFRPGSLATTTVAVFLLLAALVSLDAADILETAVPDSLIRVAIWTIAGAFLLRSIGDFRTMGITKRVRGTLFAQMDSLLFTPLCFLLSLLAFAIANSST